MVHFATRLPMLGAVAALFCAAQTGCGSSAQSSTAPVATNSVSTAANNNALEVQIASSDLAVGRNRLTFGVIANNRPLSVSEAGVTFFFLRGSQGTAIASSKAHFNYFAKDLRATDANSAAIQLGGVYVTHPTFRQAGTWAIQVQIAYRGRLRIVRSAPFLVNQRSVTPAVGSPAPRSHNPTIAQTRATLLDSGRPPDDMHRLSIADAVAQHRPLVVLFATAAYCTSRLCGPEIQVVQQLEQRYRGRVNFIHIEIYRDAKPPKFAPAVVQWRLQTEPWVFVINRSGNLADKFEGPTPASELAPAIAGALR